MNKIYLKKVKEDALISVASKLIEWNYVYKRYIRLAFICFIGTLLITLTIYIFSLLFQQSHYLISANNEKITSFDCFYFSAVTYFTVGYGDITPNREFKEGEILFITECFVSLILNSIFIGFLTYNLLKTYNSIKVSKFLYIIEKESGSFILRFRIADFKNSFINYSYTIQFFDWHYGQFRITLAKDKEEFSEFEFVFNTTIIITSDSKKKDKSIGEYFQKLFESEDNLSLKNYNLICVTLTATSIKTGDNVVVRKYYKGKHIKLVSQCEHVFKWDSNSAKPSPRKWANLNRFTEMSEERKEVFVTTLNKQTKS
jgi:Ion channel